MGNLCQSLGFCKSVAPQGSPVVRTTAKTITRAINPRNAVVFSGLSVHNEKLAASRVKSATLEEPKNQNLIFKDYLMTIKTKPVRNNNITSESEYFISSKDNADGIRIKKVIENSHTDGTLFCNEDKVTVREPSVGGPLTTSKIVRTHILDGKKFILTPECEGTTYEQCWSGQCEPASETTFQRAMDRIPKFVDGELKP